MLHTITNLRIIQSRTIIRRNYYTVKVWVWGIRHVSNPPRPSVCRAEGNRHVQVGPETLLYHSDHYSWLQFTFIKLRKSWRRRICQSYSTWCVATGVKHIPSPTWLDTFLARPFPLRYGHCRLRVNLLELTETAEGVSSKLKHNFLNINSLNSE